MTRPSADSETEVGSPPGRWLVRAMVCGETTDERTYGLRLLRRVAELLPGVPVGFLPAGIELVHPARDAIDAVRVGHVLRAWIEPEGLDLLAEIEITDPLVQRGLEGLARDRRLHQIGISPILTGPVYRPDQRAETVDVVGVASLDLVTKPAGIGCHVLARIA
jgi:hypothetical protein